MRCTLCRKKTIMISECKCLEKFCLNCLPHDIHNCIYDYKQAKKDILTEANPKIIPPKVTIF